MVDYARVSMELEKLRPPKLIGKRPARRKKRERHAQTKVAFFRYGYYDIAFKYFTERVLDAEFVPLPPATRRTLELGSQHSNDFVCAPFKHILGDYLEALELGADVLVQFTGPCRLGYYGEVQESILRDLGYDFRMLNFAVVGGKPATEYVKLCRRTVNPNVSLKQGVVEMMTTFRLIECLDAYHDAYLERAGFALDADEPKRLQSAFYRAMRAVTSRAEVEAAYAAGLEALERMPQRTVADPVRVGIVGEYFTAVDAHSNLNVEEKLLSMGVKVARMLNITNRNLRYNEKNLRASAAPYVRYDMGPTSTLTVAAAKKYAEEGFDGIIHLKSSGCTPEIDCMPVLQRVSRDYGIPVLYLSFDSQTSDTGLDTRLEAFYDMISMRKAAPRAARPVACPRTKEGGDR